MDFRKWAEYLNALIGNTILPSLRNISKENAREVGKAIAENKSDDLERIFGALSQIKGEKGDQGYTPKKGKDYLTPDEIDEWKEELRPKKGVDYRDGVDGKTPRYKEDYLTDAEIEEIKIEITPVKNVDYRDGIDGYTPQKGKDYFDGIDGKDGSPDKAADIKKKLESLTGDRRLDASAIKGIPELVATAKSYMGRGVKNLVNLYDVLITNPQNNQILKYDSTSRKWVNGTGGGGGGTVDSVGAGTGITVDNTDPANPIVATTITQYTDEMAQDAIGNNVGAGLSYNDATGTVSSTITQYTDELAQDAVGGILTDSSEIDFTYNDATPSITASLVAGSIDETKLDASTNASLDLADSSLQPGDNISELTNNEGFISDITGLIDEGTNVTITGTGTSGDPYIINSTASGGGGVESVVAGTNIDVDATDPANPIVSVETLTLTDISDVTASASEVNILDGATLSTTELNYVDGVTSAIQTQLDSKIGGSTGGTDNRLLRSDGTGGKTLQNTGVTIDDSDNFSGVESMTFDGQTSPTYGAGKLVYDTDNESLTFFNNDSSVALQIGQEAWIRVRNDTGSTIANGTPVYISGTHASGIPQVTPAQANSVSTVIVAGLTTEAIANNSVGYVTSIGSVRNVDTSAFSAGASLFVSPTVAGGLTTTAPTAPNYRFRVGIVIRSHAINGVIHVTPSTGALGNGTANQIFGINNAGTAQEVKSINGTSNDITVTHGANSITLATGSNVYKSGGTDVAVADGGTGVSTLTGIVKGNGTSAFSAAVAGTDYMSPTAFAYVLVQDQKAQNTDGGGFTSGAWQTRTINTEVVDTGNNASLSSNQITLLAGTYRFRITVPATEVNRHQARLRNVTDGTTVANGTSEYATSTATVVTRSVISGRFTIASSKAFEVQHQCQTTRASSGFGVAGNFATEIFTEAEFWKE